jgi:hypothetical protein
VCAGEFVSCRARAARPDALSAKPTIPPRAGMIDNGTPDEREERAMCELNPNLVSELRSKYEKLDASHQRGLPSFDSSMQQLTTDEILAVFHENNNNPQRWPTFTDLESHLRTCATLRRYNAPFSVV